MLLLLLLLCKSRRSKKAAGSNIFSGWRRWRPTAAAEPPWGKRKRRERHTQARVCLWRPRVTHPRRHALICLYWSVAREIWLNVIAKFSEEKTNIDKHALERESQNKRRGIWYDQEVLRHLWGTHLFDPIPFLIEIWLYSENWANAYLWQRPRPGRDFHIYSIKVPLNNDHLSTTSTILGSQWWPLHSGLTVFFNKRWLFWVTFDHFFEYSNTVFT